MKAVLLCAGFGTRMYPLTRDRAKPLLPVAGKPIVEHLVDALRAGGLTGELIVVSNARFHDDFVAWSEGRTVVLDNGVSDERDRLGAVRDLAEAVRARGIDEPMVVAAGDNLFRDSLGPLLSDYETAPRNLILRYHERDREILKRTGVAEIDDDGRLVRLVEKPKSPPTEWACPAFYVLEPDAIAELEPYLEAHPDADALGGFIAWLAPRCPVYTHMMQGRRLDVGEPAGYASAESWLKTGD